MSGRSSVHFLFLLIAIFVFIQPAIAQVVLSDTSDFKVDDLFESSVPRDLEGLAAYNLMKQTEIREGVEWLRILPQGTNFSVPNPYQKRTDERWQAFETLKKNEKHDGETKAFLKTLGKFETQTGKARAGSSIYYPFAGVDVMPAFVFPDAVDCFAQTGSPVMNLEDLRSLRKTENYDLSGGSWEQFMSKQTLLYALEDTKGSMAGLYLSRIVNNVDADILGIIPLEINSDGKLRLLKSGEAPNEILNSLVVYREKSTGLIKRRWSFHANTTGDRPQDKNFARLMTRLKFGRMVLSGAPSMAFEDSADARGVSDFILKPAKQNDAVIISEERIDPSSGNDREGNPQPIFDREKKGELIAVQIPEDHVFGYSMPRSYWHSYVFVAPASALKDNRRKANVKRTDVTAVNLAGEPVENIRRNQPETVFRGSESPEPTLLARNPLIHALGVCGRLLVKLLRF
jgi:hypothetical protein